MSPNKQVAGSGFNLSLRSLAPEQDSKPLCFRKSSQYFAMVCLYVSTLISLWEKLCFIPIQLKQNSSERRNEELSILWQQPMNS